MGSQQEQEQEQEQQQLPPFTSPADLLRFVYADVTRLEQVSAPSIVLHPAVASGNGQGDRIGIKRAQQHEEELVKALGGKKNTKMEVESLVANADFGCVMGRMVAEGRSNHGEESSGNDELDDEDGRGDRLEVSFCGVWRFEWKDEEWESGRKKRTVWAAEHWENLTVEGKEEAVRWLKGRVDT